MSWGFNNTPSIKSVTKVSLDKAADEASKGRAAIDGFRQNTHGILELLADLAEEFLSRCVQLLLAH